MAPYRDWSVEEDVLLIYFYSRRVLFATISEIIRLKLGIDIDPDKLYPRIRQIREKERLAGRPFQKHRSPSWILENVDRWLLEQLTRNEVLELVAIDMPTCDAILSVSCLPPIVVEVGVMLIGILEAGWEFRLWSELTRVGSACMRGYGAVWMID